MRARSCATGSGVGWGGVGWGGVACTVARVFVSACVPLSPVATTAHRDSVLHMRDACCCLVVIVVCACDSYADSMATTRKRRAHLLTTYNFVCRCTRCAIPDRSACAPHLLVDEELEGTATGSAIPPSSRAAADLDRSTHLVNEVASGACFLPPGSGEATERAEALAELGMLGRLPHGLGLGWMRGCGVGRSVVVDAMTGSCVSPPPGVRRPQPPSEPVALRLCVCVVQRKRSA